MLSAVIHLEISRYLSRRLPTDFEIVLTVIVLQTVCYLNVEIALRFDLGTFTRIGLVGATALGGRPILIGIVRRNGIGSGLITGNIINIFF